MVNLDDRNAILQTQGDDTVLHSVDALPNQLKQAFTESLEVKFPDEYKKIKNVVVCGMGGSRFPSLILRDLFKEEIKVPYVVNDDYILPGYIGAETLVILSSYSGTTEEVIHAGQVAQEKGAMITGITNGGQVAEFLQKNNLPFYTFDAKFNPSKQPRIGFGYLVGGHLGLLINLGLVDVAKEMIEQSLDSLSDLLQSFKVESSITGNPAKQIATKLYQKYPYYIVSEFLTGVGNAIGNQTNETAKAISSYRVIPELNHHLMEGLKFPDKHREIAAFVFFYSNLYSPQIRKRFTITKDVVEQNKIETIWHELQGKTKIDQAFELMGMGSYISMYLAVLYEQNPAAIPYVDYFKKKLKEME